MFALSFFGIIHVPINVPALGIAVQQDDVNINRELFGHGLSNALSGMVGSIQNYLVFANSRLFIQNGGNNRGAGVLLAIATTGIWIAGPTMIGYIPIMIVGTLIFMLGIEMVQEALWDTFGKLQTLEYLMVREPETGAASLLTHLGSCHHAGHGILRLRSRHCFRDCSRLPYFRRSNVSNFRRPSCLLGHNSRIDSSSPSNTPSLFARGRLANQARQALWVSFLWHDCCGGKESSRYD